MKKILFTAVSAMALAAFAEGVNSTEFGTLKVMSSEKVTIVSVPWLESGTADNPVTVSNLVLTAGLKTGDMLQVYGTSGYTDKWMLNENKTWQPVTIVTSDGVKKSGDDQTTVPRGKAIMLKRENPGDCFYLMGKPASSEGGTFSDILGGSATAPAYTLIAPARTQATPIGDLTFGGSMSSVNEYIILDDGTTLTWVEGSGWYNPKSKAYNDKTIPAGHGVWFRSCSSGTKTVTWPN